MQLQGSCIPYSDHGIAASAAQVYSAHGQRMHCAAMRVCRAAAYIRDPSLGQAAQGEDLRVARRLQRIIAGQKALDGSVLCGNRAVSA